jgi:hypothetical protein
MAVHSVDDFEQQLLFVLRIHNSIRKLCGFEAGTDEGHFINENTVVRLAAMMEDRKPTLKPRGLPKGFNERPKDSQDAYISGVFEKASDAERSVRTLFLFRNLIVHAGGRFDLGTTARLPLPFYQWFCCKYKVPPVGEGCKLVLAGFEVITPLVEGCVGYYRESVGAAQE